MGKYREHISKVICAYRKALGMKQSDLAEQLNVAKSSVSAWENNSNAPDVETLAKLCDIFDISMDEMYGIVKNDTIALNKTEKNLITTFRAVNTHGQQKILDYAEDINSSDKYKKIDYTEEKQSG